MVNSHLALVWFCLDKPILNQASLVITRPLSKQQQVFGPRGHCLLHRLSSINIVGAAQEPAICQESYKASGLDAAGV